MSDTVYTTDQIKTILYPIFVNYNVQRAILFGSYGKGIATKDSDVDLLVDSRLKGLKFVGLLENMRTVMDKEIDLFDVTHIETDSKIDKEIKETGVLIYEK